MTRGWGARIGVVLLAFEVSIVRSISCPITGGASSSIGFDQCWPDWSNGTLDSCGGVCIPSSSLNPCCNTAETLGCRRDILESDLALACGAHVSPGVCNGGCADVRWASIGGDLDVLGSSSVGMDGAFPQLISVGTLRDQDNGIRLVDVDSVPASAFPVLK